MLSREIRNELLIDEMQIGERLNTSLQAKDRADFDLMLAMLSPDVTDAAGYSKPEKLQPQEQDLRQRLGLQPPVRLYAKADDFARADNLKEIFSSEGITAVFFRECLRPEPLNTFNRDFPPEVVGNLSPLSQEKLRLKSEGRELEYEKIQERGDGFEVLSEVKESVDQLA